MDNFFGAGVYGAGKGPLRQIQKKIKTEIDFTLAYVVREAEKLKLPAPLCGKVLDMIHELEAGQRQFGMQTTSS